MKTKRYLNYTLVLLLSACAAACSGDNDDSPPLPQTYSAYITKVFDFMPAPGQFINELPEYKEGDTHQKMIEKAEEAIKGEKPKSMISLGGFGGYVVFGFDHMVENVAGSRDFRVLGNAFWENVNPSARGGSCEPGVIMVMHDTNGNGMPDDRWYEIAGSEYANSTKNYTITYYKPDPDKEPVLDDNASYATDTEYIRWTDNRGNSGFKMKNSYHSQSYWPEWAQGNTLTFTGTLLPDNGVDESGTGSYWVLYSHDYGYADNAPNNDPESAIDIDWAVDGEGNPANLPGIHFVKVYNGVNQECGWLGENSTEVAGACDLHMLGISIETR